MKTSSSTVWASSMRFFTSLNEINEVVLSCLVLSRLVTGMVYCKDDLRFSVPHMKGNQSSTTHLITWHATPGKRTQLEPFLKSRCLTDYKQIPKETERNSNSTFLPTYPCASSADGNQPTKSTQCNVLNRLVWISDLKTNSICATDNKCIKE